MFSSENNSDTNTNFFALSAVHGLIVAGLTLLVGAMLLFIFPVPLGAVVGFSAFLGGVYFYRDFQHVADKLEYVWGKRQDMEAERLQFEGRMYSGQWPAPSAFEPEPPAGAPVTVGHPQGTYTLPPITAEEMAERAAIGQALIFLTLAERAGGLTERTMQTVRPPHHTESSFEHWWKKTSDQLAQWGLVEKGDRTTTRLAAKYPTFDAARTALLRRTFIRHTHVSRWADSQTDSQTAAPATA